MTPATTPAELLHAFARTRASLDGAEVTFWWSGDVYTWAPVNPTSASSASKG